MESVHDELIRISDELDRMELYGAAQAMVRGAREIHQLKTRVEMMENTIQKMIESVPGGQYCDPQEVCDTLRAVVREMPTIAREPGMEVA